MPPFGAPDFTQFLRPYHSVSPAYLYVSSGMPNPSGPEAEVAGVEAKIKAVEIKQERVEVALGKEKGPPIM